MSFAPLELANGPECNRCGCRDAEILRLPPPPTEDGVPTWWAQGRAHCRHCGNRFTFRELPAPIAPPPVVDEALAGMEFEAADIEPVDTPPKPRDTAYPVRECPKCGSPNVKVKSSPKSKPGMPKIRYHECKGCGEGFKSIDTRHLNRREA